MSFRPGEIVMMPSPIDVHTHLREPGGTDKETIASGTMAALSGGYQAVFDMPNNPGGMQTWTEARLDRKLDIGRRTARTSIGFYAGVNLEDPDIDQLPRMIGKAAGLKLYMGHTTNNAREYGFDDARPAIDTWMRAADHTGGRPPILLHAREGVGEEAARYVAEKGYPVHWCHIATETEARSSAMLSKIFPDYFTSGITPHHLTMTAKDADFKYGWNGGRMMPPLGENVDHDMLLRGYNDGWIQILETDHAPHSDSDKLQAERENPEGDDGADCTTCFGVSGIEFVLPVMMSLVQRKKISMERLKDSLYTQPARMLGLKAGMSAGKQTLVRVDPYTIQEKDRVGMSKNNPYVGWTAWGRVEGFMVGGKLRSLADMALRTEVELLRAGSEV